MTALLAAAVLITSCAKDTIEAETFGSIGGIVLDGETDEGIVSANITTTPATNAILSENGGQFTLEEVPTGNYTISARKNGYKNSSVSVAVREGKTASAFVVMQPDDEEPDSTVTMDEFEASITSWFNDAEGDSSFADVNYRVSNNSDSGNISEYEVYFEVETNSGTTFFFDVAGEDLRAGQSRNGNLRGYIRDNEATDVIISDIWISEN